MLTKKDKKDIVEIIDSRLTAGFDKFLKAMMELFSLSNEKIDRMEEALNMKIDKVEEGLNNKFDKLDKRLANVEVKLDQAIEHLYPSYAGLQPIGLSKQLRGVYTRANSFASGIEDHHELGKNHSQRLNKLEHKVYTTSV